jgi:hypothetical protein
MPAYWQRAATSTEVTGQSGQSKLHTVREHRPGGALRPPNRTTRTDGRDCDLARSHMAWERRRSRPWADIKPARATARNRRRRPGAQLEGPQLEARCGPAGWQASSERWTGTTFLAASSGRASDPIPSEPAPPASAPCVRTRWGLTVTRALAGRTGPRPFGPPASARHASPLCTERLGHRTHGPAAIRLTGRLPAPGLCTVCQRLRRALGRRQHWAGGPGAGAG